MQLFASELPELPQMRTLDGAIGRLVLKPEIKLIWLGGSFATGKADRYSDVDLRLAVDADRFDEWLNPDLALIFGEPSPVCMVMSDPGKSVLHHVLLGNGELFDVYIQPFPPAFVEAEILPLAIADGLEYEFATRSETDAPAGPQVLGAEIETILRNFWINTHKHRKVLDRNLDLMAHIGLRFDQDVLRRLWLLNLTGSDDRRRQTIHTMTGQIRAITDGIGDRAFAVLGLPLRTRAELIAAIEATRAETGRVGRELAESYHFEYPFAAERIALDGWREWKGGPEL